MTSDDNQPGTTDTRSRFVRAWKRFAQETSGTVAPEATYQAWFAHFLIEEFGLLRVVREVDFGARHLHPDDQRTFDGNNLRLDICILRSSEDVYLPHRSALGDPATSEGYAAHSGLGRLKDLAVISELKIGSSVTGGLPYAQINRDARKMQALMAAAREHPLGKGHPMPMAFMCVLDNHRTWRLNRQILNRYQQRYSTTDGIEWLIAPTNQRRRGKQHVLPEH